MPSDPVAGRVRGMVVGQGSYKQKTLSVTRNMVVLGGMVAGEGGRSTGILLYEVDTFCRNYTKQLNTPTANHTW